MEKKEKSIQNYEVLDTRNRYFVPFEFPKDFEFDVVCKSIDDKRYEDGGHWVRSAVRSDNKGNGEDEDDDLFRLIVDEFTMVDRKRDANNLGCHWLYKVADGGSVLNFLYNQADGKFSMQVDIAELGLYIFRTGIGILWYQVEFKPDNDQIMDSERLISFQHIFNKLNDDIHIRMWMDNCLCLNPASSRASKILAKTAKACGDGESVSVLPDERLPFSLGNWLAEQLSFLQVEYFFQRKNHYPKDLMTYYERSRHDYIIPEDISYKVRKKCKERDELIKGYLEHVRGKMEESAFYKQFPAMCPNKGIIFSYTYFKSDDEDADEKEQAHIVYLLANGYNRNFNYSDHVRATMKKPFKNVFWYATREGGGYYAFEKADNYFYGEVAPRKIRANYFVLLVKVLYQSYSLLHFTHLLSGSEISVDYRDYMAIEDDENIDKELRKHLSKLRSMINVFLLKSIVTSVGHVQHLNEYYSYLEKQLYIKEDIESVTAGLDVMDDLVKEQMEKDKAQLEKAEEKLETRKYQKLQIVLAVIAGFTMASTISDTHAFLNARDTNQIIEYEYIIFGLYLAVLVGTVYWVKKH